MENTDKKSITPEDLQALGFKKQGLRNDIYRKKNLYLQKKSDGFYIVDSFLEAINSNPVTNLKDLITLDSLLL